MAKTKSRAPAIAVAVPQSRDEAAATLAHIGELNRRVGRLEADMNDELTRIKAGFAEQAAPLQTLAKAKIEALQVWCAANRDAIVAKGTKTADLGTGKVSWRIRPPSVRITKVEDVIEAIKRLGLQRFIRTKEEANKEALAAEPEVARLIAGVSIGSEGEDFIVEPFEADLSQVAA